MPCRIELQVFLHPQISASPLALHSFIFGFDAKGHDRTRVSLKFIFCLYSLWDELGVRGSAGMWWNNTNAVTAWDWTQLWQMGMEELPDLPASEAAAATSPPTSADDIPAVLPQPAQGRAPSCLMNSSVSFPCCLKSQGEQRCKVIAVLVLMLHFGSRREFLLLLLLHQLQWELGGWVDTALPGVRLPFPGHSVELAPDKRHWALIHPCSRMGLCCRTSGELLINICSKHLLSTGSRNIWNINQYRRSLKTLSTQFTILYK